MLDDPAVDSVQEPPLPGVQVGVLKRHGDRLHLGDEPVEGFEGQPCVGRELKRALQVTLAAGGLVLDASPSSLREHVDREHPAEFDLVG